MTSPVVARPGGLRALNAAQRRGLRPILRSRESHAVSDIGDGIAVRVNLDFVQRLGREGLGGGGPRRVHAADGCTFMIRIDLPGSPGLGKAYRSVRSRRASPRGNPSWDRKYGVTLIFSSSLDA